MDAVLAAALTIAQALQAAPPAPGQPPAQHPAVVSVYVPERVFDTRRKTFSDFEAMLADLARADVVLVGEQHDDPNTHRLEAAILQGLLRRRVPVTVSLEMFERDVQAQVDAYLAGRVPEEEFLKDSRPWPRYASDYRPLLEMAKAHGWPVVAANAPRKYATEIAKTGLASLDKLAGAERAFVARDLQCPLDDYFDRFVETMGDHPGSGGAKASDQRAIMERYYQSQCAKDETMAEAIALSFEKQAGKPGTIVHFTGSFHTDFGAGTAERVRRRLPGRRVAVVSMLPDDDLDNLDPDADDLKRAEYLVYTAK